jgi:hypothetical protein
MFCISLPFFAAGGPLSHLLPALFAGVLHTSTKIGYHFASLL